MNRAKAKKKWVRQSAPDSVASEPTGLVTVFVALIACAFLWPSLGAIDGDGLHLTFLWLLMMSAVLLWKRWHDSDAVDTARSPRRSVNRWFRQCLLPQGLVTAGLSLFLCGVWLSTWNVFRVSGDRRAALNLAFAWTAICACAWLCRIVTGHLASRRAVVNLVAGLSVGLAVYGIWQKHVYYPTEAKAYLEKRQVLDKGSSPSEIAKVQQEFLSSGILLDGPTRALFEERLLHSSEPFGPFALANTLAGVLAAGFVLLIGGLISEWRGDGRHWSRLAVPLIAVTVVTWCLILTKSRTAWIGAAAGTTVLLLAHHCFSPQKSRSGLQTAARIVLMIGVPAALLLITGFLTGAIDREVLLESPRSLQFRLFYWTGAAGIICDDPLFGAGPGNFRQLYLAHKPLESSEAIQDPHNFLLDAWCFAGVTGFLGILMLVAGVTRAITTHADPHGEAERPGSISLTPGLIGCLFAHFGWLWLSGSALGPQDVMTAVTILIAGVAAAAACRLRWNSLAPAAACVTLLVHMLGAGGLQITTMWFLLVALITAATPHVRDSRTDPLSTIPARIPPMPGAVLWAAVAAAAVWWGLVPVLGARVQQGIGLHRLRAGDQRGALHAFELAAEADPLSPAIRQQIVNAAAYSLMQQDARNSLAAEKAIAADQVEVIESACASHIQSDTRGIGGRIARARIYHRLYRLTGQSVYIESCIDDFRHVVARHPTNALLQLELAVCEEAAGETASAVESAKKAKYIENVNRAWGHSDQYLDEDQLMAVDRILNGGNQ